MIKQSKGAAPQRLAAQLEGSAETHQRAADQLEQFIKIGQCFEVVVWLLGGAPMAVRASLWCGYIRREILR